MPETIRYKRELVNISSKIIKINLSPQKLTQIVCYERPSPRIKLGLQHWFKDNMLLNQIHALILKDILIFHKKHQIQQEIPKFYQKRMKLIACWKLISCLENKNSFAWLLNKGFNKFSTKNPILIWTLLEQFWTWFTACSRNN
jgi:hypothetical protein